MISAAEQVLAGEEQPPTGDRPPAPDEAHRRHRLSGWMVSGVRGYQLLRSGRPTGCRYLPTCSEYAVDALEQHGAVRGTVLTVRRLLRCNPWGGHGLDPVPHRRTSCTHP